MIEVPLATLRGPRRSSARRRGSGAASSTRCYFYQVSAEDLVWGATARILKQFLDMLDEEAE